MKLDEINEILIFSEQPVIESADIDSFQRLGFLTVKDDVIELVSYRPFDICLRTNPLNQNDARRLMVLETIRESGRPRTSHIARLMVAAFAREKQTVINRIEKTSKRLWREKAQ